MYAREFKGKPSSYRDMQHVDWVPNLNLDGLLVEEEDKCDVTAQPLSSK